MSNEKHLLFSELHVLDPPLWKFKTKIMPLDCASFVLVCAFNPIVCAQKPFQAIRISKWEDWSHA
jgi:hypothetical protein